MFSPNNVNRVIYMKVTVYSGEGCPPCAMVKNYLKDKGVEYEEIDLTKEGNEEIAEKLMKETGKIILPVIELKGKRVLGFNTEELDELIKG